MVQDPNELENEQQPAPHPPAQAVRAMTLAYLSALLLIAVLTVAGHLVARDMLANSRQDGRVVNLAGRQRMLSQRITKANLLAAEFPGTARGRAAAEEAAEAARQFRASHDLLAGGGENVPTPTDPLLTELYAKAGPAVAEVVAAVGGPGEAVADRAAEFLPVMEAIVGRHEALARDRIHTSETVILVLAGVTLLVLVAEGLLIFRPLAGRVRAMMEHDQEVAQNAILVARYRAVTRREIERAREQAKVAENDRDRAVARLESAEQRLAETSAKLAATAARLDDATARREAA